MRRLRGMPVTIGHPFFASGTATAPGQAMWYLPRENQGANDAGSSRRGSEMEKKQRAKGSTGERLLRILSAVVEADGPVDLPLVTETVDLPKPTAHRLLTLLEQQGYLVRDTDGRSFTPGPVLNRVACRVLQSKAAKAPRHAILERIAATAGEACNLVVMDGNHITYIDRIDSAWPLSIRLAIGSEVPLHCTATGKLLTSLQPKRVRRRLLSTLPLSSWTPHTITDPTELEAELETIRKARVGTDNQEFIEGMVAVSVPIPPPAGPPIAAVSIHAPVFRKSLADLKTHIPLLQESADKLATIIHDQEGTASAN